ISFSCYNGYTTLGQSVYAVGSVAQLGNWAVESAVKLDPSQYPTWSATITVPAQQDVEWKCIKRDESDPTANLVWQSGSNNQFNSDNQTTTQGSF
ncbi:carbohydrate-binding module family 20 domain-containing protein, partial [Vibrio furnissii]|uniref:carbohydrate-binding module family 20 domain-containing protein n=1 Tax=Vibrio furnissii TaxID=29494 RepID=UPI00237C28B2|nr:cyclomaltodextrin glucanotransferase [Vibrio furnissii]